MEVIEINDNLLDSLHLRASETERLRMNFDLRTTPQDGSQRMLNALEVGTRVPIHRHLETAETAVCLHGCMDYIFYDFRPNVDINVVSDLGTMLPDGMEVNFIESGRVRLCPREGRYGVQVPLGTATTPSGALVADRDSPVCHSDQRSIVLYSFRNNFHRPIC